ncbi:hypothetical protein EMIT0232MI5_110085 [Pseudomonas sp. IT-232MI5]
MPFIRSKDRSLRQLLHRHPSTGVPLGRRACYHSRALLRVILTKVLGLKVDLNTRELHTRPILNSVVTVHATDYKRPIRRDRHA